MVLFVSIFQTDVGLYSIYNNMRKKKYIVPTSSPDPMKPCDPLLNMRDSAIPGISTQTKALHHGHSALLKKKTHF